MRQLRIDRGLLYFLGELEFTEAALAADDDAQILAPAFQEAIAEFDTIFAKERAAARAVIRTEAVVAVRNQQLDGETMRMSMVARAVASQLVDRIFPKTPGRFVRGPLRRQCEVTLTLIVVELNKLDDSHALKPYAPKLMALAQAGVAALDARAGAKGTRQAVRNDLDEWKEGVNALRTTTYAELLKIATDKGHAKAWVETFFRQQPSRRSRPDPDEDDGEDTSDTSDE